MRRRFSSLQWRLTCSYTLITTAVIGVLLIALTSLVWAFVSDFPRERLISFVGSEILGAELGTALQDPVDVEVIDAWVDSSYRDNVLHIESPFSSVDFGFDLSEIFKLIITTAVGQFIVGRNGDGSTIESLELVPSGAQREWERERLRVADWSSFFYDDIETETLWIFTPIYNQDEIISTVIVETQQQADPIPLWAVLVSIPIPLFFPVICLASFVGILAGALSARGLSRRLNRLTATADSWAKGDFSVVVKDRTTDEIGLLGQQLNQMAEEIQLLLQSKTALATVEERNRIARDLHDSAKQQIFAATMQISTAKALFKVDPDAAMEHLTEAETLAKQIQKELSGLIQELRPAQLEDSGLAEAMQTAVDQWSNRHDIPADFGVQGDRKLPLSIEEPLFRITQEGLSNIAKHSKATQVQVHLFMSNTYVRLTIEDNGVGFDPKGTSAGFGLHSIRERVENLGGKSTIHTTIGKGTALNIEIPLEKNKLSADTNAEDGGWWQRFFASHTENRQ
ncbi:MAG: sensor histidine kinase [Chloroflexota bacterium]